MRRLAILNFMLIFSFTLCSTVYCKEEKIVKKDNKYGGITEEEIYDKDSKKYKEGLARILEHYDSNKMIQEIESFYTDEHTKKYGVYRKEQYYNNKPFHKTVLKKAEYFYADFYAQVYGINRAEEHFDEDGKKERTEYFYTDEWEKKHHYKRMEVYHEKDGEISKRVYYDKAKNILHSEKPKKD